MELLKLVACPARQAVLALSLATLTCLVPFGQKAFHIDDPLFLWTGKQILSHPLDFYGFNLNWRGTEVGMAEVLKNPPGVSYSIALSGRWLGWSELALHLAFLIPAIMAVIGIYFLGRFFCASPFSLHWLDC